MINVFFYASYCIHRTQKLFFERKCVYFICNKHCPLVVNCSCKTIFQPLLFVLFYLNSISSCSQSNCPTQTLNLYFTTRLNKRIIQLFQRNHFLQSYKLNLCSFFWPSTMLNRFFNLPKFLNKIKINIFNNTFFLNSPSLLTAGTLNNY